MAGAVRHDTDVRLSSLWRMAVGLALGFGGAITVISAIDMLSVSDSPRQQSVVVQLDDVRQYCERRGMQLAGDTGAASTWSCVDPAARTAGSVTIVPAELCLERFGTTPSATDDGVIRCNVAP